MEKRQQRVFVCGATGKKGGAVVRSLVKDGRWEITAGTTDLSAPAAKELSLLGVKVSVIHLQSQLSLQKAFNGMDAVFAVTQPWSTTKGCYDIRMEILHAKNMIWAAREAGVKHFVFSSFLNPGNEPTGVNFLDSKLLIEGLIHDSKIPYTIIRSGIYMDNVRIDYPGRTVGGNFEPTTRIPYHSLSDFGQSTADILNDRQTYVYDTIDLIGDFRSGLEMAELLTQQHPGRRFIYRPRSAVFLWLFERETYKLRKYMQRNSDEISLAYAAGESRLRSKGIHTPGPFKAFLERYKTQQTSVK